MDSNGFWSFRFPMGDCCQTLDDFFTEFRVPAGFRADKGWDSWSIARLKLHQWIVNEVSLTFSWINQILQGVLGVTSRCFLCDHPLRFTRKILSNRLDHQKIWKRWAINRPRQILRDSFYRKGVIQCGTVILIERVWFNVGQWFDMIWWWSIWE